MVFAKEKGAQHVSLKPWHSALSPTFPPRRMGAWFGPSTSPAAPRPLEALLPQDPVVTSQVVIRKSYNRSVPTTNRALKQPESKNVIAAANTGSAQDPALPPERAGSSRLTPTSGQKGAQPVEVPAGGGPSGSRRLRHRGRGIGRCQGRRRRHQDQGRDEKSGRQFTSHWLET